MPHRHRRFQSLPRALVRLLLPALGALLAACSHQSAETARHLELMNERLLILQNDRDRLVERVDALESNATARSLTAEPTRAAPARAPLKVVKLIPSPEGEQDAADGQAEPRSENLAPDSVAQRQAAGGTGGEALQAPTAGPKSDTEATVVLYGEGAASGVRKRVAGEQP